MREPRVRHTAHASGLELVAIGGRRAQDRAQAELRNRRHSHDRDVGVGIGF